MNASMKWALATCVFAVAAGMFATLPWVNARPKAAGSSVQVKIDNFTFTPPTLTVPAGTTVEWVNYDDIPHTVVSDDLSTFKSKALDTDDNYSHLSSKAGTYSYFCSIHPKMTGKVVVQ